MLPREKFLHWGVKSLSVDELIAIILSSGTKTSSVFKISKIVSKIIKSQNLNLDILSKVSGLGAVKSMKLLCAVELGKRVVGEKTAYKMVISTSKTAYETLKYISRYRQEHFVCIFLNARYELLGKKVVGIGTFDSVQVLPRDIILSALEFNSAYVIIAHNHPSEDLSPSEQDLLVTKRIKSALELVGITLLDHLVIGKQGWQNISIK